MQYDPRPVYEVPELPWDITSVSDTDLMDLFTKQIAWQNFFATQVAFYEIEEAEAEAHLKAEEARRMLASGKEKITEARWERDADPEIEQAHKEYRISRAKRKMLQVSCENRERCAMLISRELTRRTGRGATLQARGDRWTP